jgi:hypothetical protein
MLQIFHEEYVNKKKMNQKFLGDDKNENMRNENMRHACRRIGTNSHKQTNDFVATKPQNFTSTWWQMEYAACVPQNLNKLTKNRQMILRQRCRKISGARGGKTELQWNRESGI